MSEGTENDGGDLIEVRKAKMEKLRESGMELYASGYERSCLSGDIKSEWDSLEPGESTDAVVEVAGRMIAVRRHGRASFVDLKDPQGKIQLYFREDILGEEDYEKFTQLDIGDWVGARGKVFRSRTGELSVEVENFELLSKSLRPLPEKWHGLQDQEARYRQRYLDLIMNPEAVDILELRKTVIKRARDFLDSQGFLEVETPVLQDVPGGANARPFVTHHNALGIDMYLRIAPELYLKRLLIGGMEKVYEIGRNFRNEGISSRHNPEFTMLEAYQAFSDYRDLKVLVQDLVCHIVMGVRGGLLVEYQGELVDFTPPWREMTMLESLRERLGLELDFDTDLDTIRGIARERDVPLESYHGKGWAIAQLFEKLVEEELRQPTFILDYPKEISPLARSVPGDENLTERFEVLVTGREIANAFSELTDPEEQRTRFEEQAKKRSEGDTEAHPLDEDFLTALEYGMPPAGGLGVGIDRLVMILADCHNIRDVITFPQLRPK